MILATKTFSQFDQFFDQNKEGNQVELFEKLWFVIMWRLQIFDVRKILGIAKKDKYKPKIKGNSDKNAKNNNKWIWIWFNWSCKQSFNICNGI